jgi:hypothetical protein
LNPRRYGVLSAILLVAMASLVGLARQRRAERPRKSVLLPALQNLPETGAPGAETPTGGWRAVRPDMFAGPSQTLSHSTSPEGGRSTTSPSDALPATPANDPLADYAYSGTVTVDGKTMALIEHRKSREGWYVSVGDTWQGFPVVAVDNRQVIVDVNGERHILGKTDPISLVPLNADANNADSGNPASAVTTYLGEVLTARLVLEGENSVSGGLLQSLQNNVVLQYTPSGAESTLSLDSVTYSLPPSGAGDAKANISVDYAPIEPPSQ